MSEKKLAQNNPMFHKEFTDDHRRKISESVKRAYKQLQDQES